MDGMDWRKSSFSGSGGNGCVEVAFLSAEVAVRDTKNRSLAPHRFAAVEWAAFLAGVRAGEFDRA
jgi:hypothetical protein